MRLDKFLSNLNYGSRKDINKFAKKKLIKVNGKIIEDCSINIDIENDLIYFNDTLVFYKKNVTLMLNKPKFYVCSNKDNLNKTVIDLLKPPYDRLKFFICGRLDIDTTGLVVLTTNSRLQHELTKPNKSIYKKYLVKCLNNIEDSDLKKLEEGVDINLDNKTYHTLKSITKRLDEKTFYISIKEGKFHQIKKMLMAVNNCCVELKRVSIGDIILDENLASGDYKEISGYNNFGD